MTRVPFVKVHELDIQNRPRYPRCINVNHIVYYEEYTNNVCLHLTNFEPSVTIRISKEDFQRVLACIELY